MGRTFKVSLKKIKVDSSHKNRKGYRLVRARKFLKKKSIPRIRNAKIRYTLRSNFARSISS